MSKWSVAPDFELCETTFSRLAEVKGLIRVKKTEIKIGSIEVKKTSPRKPHLVLEATQEDEKTLAQLEAEMEELEIKVKWLDFWKDMYRSDAYNRR